MRDIEAKRAYARKYYHDNKQKWESYEARRKQNPLHRESRRLASKKWRESHTPDPVEARNRNLRHSHGITLGDFNSFLMEQGGVCKVCGRPHRDENGHRLHVDHDHKTGKRRGLLCKYCNRALGLVFDNPAILTSMIKYLGYR